MIRVYELDMEPAASDGAGLEVARGLRTLYPSLGVANTYSANTVPRGALSGFYE